MKVYKKNVFEKEITQIQTLFDKLLRLILQSTAVASTPVTTPASLEETITGLPARETM